jgi:hypothetical protein
MSLSRRSVLTVIGAGLTAGCLGDGSGGTETPSPDLTECDPDDVSRPPIVEDTNHPPKGYGTQPQELTEQSVADFLVDFETAFAWNRILTEHPTVWSLGVNTTTAWTPEQAGDGFLASSNIEIDYTDEGTTEPTVRSYVASYYVSAGPVYRAETDSEAVDPRTHPDRQLVQCGTDTEKPTPESPTEATPPGQGDTHAIEYNIRNDDDQHHPLELTIESPQGTVLHQRTISEFAPDDRLRGAFTPTDSTEGEYPVTISLASLSTTIGWKPRGCARFRLFAAITTDGDLDIEREECVK